MGKMDDIITSVKGGVEKIEDKVEEIANSPKTKAFLGKAKDIAIDVGVTVADAMEELGDRASTAMHKASDRNQKKKEEEASGKKEEEASAKEASAKEAPAEEEPAGEESASEEKEQ